MYYTHKKIKPGLVASCDIRPGNGAGLFSNEKISKGGNESGKSEEKRISGEAYDINKQTIYTEDRDKKNRRAQYSSELAQDSGISSRRGGL